MDYDVMSRLRKAFALIAKGLMQKEKMLEDHPKQYPYAPCLYHGINMFLALTYEVGVAGVEIFQDADEHAFFERYLRKPISEWFHAWKPEILERFSIKEQEFCRFDEAFAFSRGENYYCASGACAEFLEAQEANIIEGTDERILYEFLKQLSQDDYCSLRQYIIEHPVITLDERRELLREYSANRIAQDAIRHAYEQFEEQAYRCPDCGWTMKKMKYGLVCHSSYCNTSQQPLEICRKWDGTIEGIYRLKKGVMRYFSVPGKPELEIALFCKKQKLDAFLWPEHDKYDLEIRFPDGDVWEIDVKAYHSPWLLKRYFENKGGFPTGKYQRGFVVIPDNLTRHESKYTDIVDEALEKQENVCCLKMRTLKMEIKRKAASNGEEE